MYKLEKYKHKLMQVNGGGGWLVSKVTDPYLNDYEQKSVYKREYLRLKQVGGDELIRDTVSAQPDPNIVFEKYIEYMRLRRYNHFDLNVDTFLSTLADINVVQMHIQHKAHKSILRSGTSYHPHESTHMKFENDYDNYFILVSLSVDGGFGHVGLDTHRTYKIDYGHAFILYIKDTNLYIYDPLKSKEHLKIDELMVQIFNNKNIIRSTWSPQNHVDFAPGLCFAHSLFLLDFINKNISKTRGKSPLAIKDIDSYFTRAGEYRLELSSFINNNLLRPIERHKGDLNHNNKLFFEDQYGWKLFDRKQVKNNGFEGLEVSGRYFLGTDNNKKRRGYFCDLRNLSKGWKYDDEGNVIEQGIFEFPDTLIKGLRFHNNLTQVGYFENNVLIKGFENDGNEIRCVNETGYSVEDVKNRYNRYISNFINNNFFNNLGFDNQNPFLLN